MSGLALSDDDLDTSRDRLRAWLSANPDPDGAALAAAGLVAPHYPAPWGHGAGPASMSKHFGAKLAPNIPAAVHPITGGRDASAASAATAATRSDGGRCAAAR